MQAILQNYDLIRQLFIFCPLIKCFYVEKSHPLIVPHEYLQPILVQILEYIHNTKYNHELYKLIQITLPEFSLNSEAHKIIRELEPVWHLLQNKYVIHMLTKLLTSSDTIHTDFPIGFFCRRRPFVSIIKYLH